MEQEATLKEMIEIECLGMNDDSHKRSSIILPKDFNFCPKCGKSIRGMDRPLIERDPTRIRFLFWRPI